MTVAQFFERHLWTILTMIALGGGGYLVGTERMIERLDRLEDRVERLEKSDEDGRAYDECSTRRFDMLRIGTKDIPDCNLGGKR